MTHLPQTAKSLKQELRGLFLTALGYKDGPLRWDREHASEAGQSHGAGCLCSLAPRLAHLSLLQSQCTSAPLPSNAGASMAAAPTRLGRDALLPGICLGRTPCIVSSTAAEKMFQGVRKFPELELVKLMY